MRAASFLAEVLPRRLASLVFFPTQIGGGSRIKNGKGEPGTELASAETHWPRGLVAKPLKINWLLLTRRGAARNKHYLTDVYDFNGLFTTLITSLRL